MTLQRRAAEPGGFTTFRRKPKPPSKRSLDPVTPEVYAAVFRRDGDCLLRGSMVPQFIALCSGRHEWQHRLPREHGGRSVPSNGARLCALHHARVGRYKMAARAVGLDVDRRAVPSQVPVTLVGGRVVYLDDAGNYLEAPDG